MPLSISGLIERFSAETFSIAVGYGIGTALAKALDPEAERLGQESWRLQPTRVLDADNAARIVTQELEREQWGRDEAAGTGLDAERFDLLVRDTLTAPDVGTLLTMWRRDAITDAQLVHGLRKHRLEPEWDAAVEKLKRQPLSPQEVAVAVQRGLLPNTGLLPVGPPTTAGKVPPMPGVDLDPFEQAAQHGTESDQLKVLTRIVGLPPAPGELFQLVNRGVIDETDFYRGIAEGNTRNEWAPFLLQLRHPILSAAEYATLHLKGWIDEAAMHAGGALHGLSTEQMDLMYLARGRPIAPVQMFQAFARKAPGPYGGTFSEADFMRAVKQSDIRPEYGPTLWATRFAYPSTFFIRFAVQHGAAPLDRVRTLLGFERYEPQDIEWLMRAFGAAGSSGQKQETVTELRAEYQAMFISREELRQALQALGYTGHVLEMEVALADAARVKATRDKIVDVIRDQYLYHEIAEPAAFAELGRLQLAGEAAQELVALWTYERTLTLRRLTPAELGKAYKKGVLAYDVAHDRLTNLGYTKADADTLLAESL